MRPLTLRTVLVATDLSDEDLAALRSAVELSRLAGADLHVAHAAAPMTADTAKQLNRHIRAADPDLTAGTTIREGPPHTVIVDIAEMIDADVIVLGPHHPSRARDAAGTAYRVAAHAGRPCLVLPDPLRLPLGRILVPVDESGAARGALSIALTWASALRRRVPPQSADATSLVVMHVSSPEPDSPQPDDVVADALAAVDERISAAAGVKVERAGESGADPATIILERSVTDDFDLIVVGTREEGHADTDLGSVASAIVRSASRAVLLVPPRVWKESGGT